MQKIIIILLSCFLITSCRQNPKELQQNLSGYWEIEKVVTLEGNVKEFKISTIVDYIHIEGNTGTRTKVGPQLDGTFKNNGSVETFTIDGSSGELVLRYKTPQHTWNEKVKKATQEKLLVVNNEGKEYYYKRFNTFTIE